MEEDELSQSPTQSNDGRSYEQYAHDTQSSRAGDSYDHRPLSDDDTGAVRFDFDHSQNSLDETAHNGLDELSRVDSHEQHPTSDSRTMPPPPETPAVFSRIMQQSTDEQLLGLSQLFGQTQYTSAVKKASPTSSRPSPNIFNHNTISPNPASSSPLKDRGLRTSPSGFVSSPAIPAHASRPSNTRAVFPGHSQEQDTAQFDLQTSRVGPEPITEYRPSRDSDGAPSGAGDGSDQLEEEAFDSYDTTDAEIRRSHIAKLKRDKADKILSSTDLARNATGYEDVEVPSTSRPKPRLIRQQDTLAERYTAQCKEKAEADKSGSQETVADSQGGQAPQAPRDPAAYTAHNPSPDEVEENDDVPESSVQPVQRDPTRPTTAPHRMLSSGVTPTESGTASSSREMIPETSPPVSWIQLPRPIGDIINQNSSATPDSAMISIPELPSSGAGSIQLGTQQGTVKGPDQLPYSHDQSARPSSASVVPDSSQQSASRRSTRSRKVTTPIPSTAPASEDGSNTSSLTTLSATPIMSSSITPNTEPDDVHDRKAHFPSSGPLISTLPASSSPPPRTSSPAEAKVQRRGRPTLPKKTYSNISVPNTSFQTRVRRSSRHSSMSTDELARSPPPLAPTVTVSADRSVLSSRRSVNTSTSRTRAPRHSVLKHRLFEGMTFAVSFQGRQAKESNDQYEERTEKAKTALERMIRQEGGHILKSGFNELFQFDSLSTSAISSASVMSSSLRLVDQDTGFTALIADGHSRKVKYMQALALGLPCLAPKWVETCVAKGELVDWSSYLLCAGQSSLLGEAIRSRNLQPYDPSTAKLAEVIEKRPKLLDGTEIILIMKARNEDKRLPYLFLAQVLGGSLVRVHTIEDARAKLLEREAGGEPFDWVYVDDQLHNAEDTLFGPGPRAVGAPQRKRKRRAPEDEGDRPPKRIRTLNDELVVQSLILGRLIEEDEM